MAQNKTIQHKRSSVAGNQPTAAQVAIGEIAINFADKSIYTQDAGGNIIELERDIIKSGVAPTGPVAGDGWYDTSTNTLKLFDGTDWVNAAYTGTAVSTGALTDLLVDHNVDIGGSGRSGTVQITGLAPNQLVSIVDTNAATNGGRYTVNNFMTDSTGTLNFSVDFNDNPDSNGGDTYTGSFEIGTGSQTVTVDVVTTINTSAAGFTFTLNYPGGVGTATTTWNHPADTLTASGCILLSTDGVNFSTSITPANGDTITTKWAGDPLDGTCIDSAHGTAITGTVTGTLAGHTDNASTTVDKTGSTALTWTDATDVALSSVSSSNVYSVLGVNSYVYIHSASGTTGLEYSVNGGTWTAVPSAPTATDYAISGDTVQIRHTNSASNSTTTSSDVYVGELNDSFDTTTIGLTASVATPSITAPTDTSTGISTSISVTSSAYSPQNGALAHQSSDWEIYDGSDPNTATLVDSVTASTTDLTSWSPTGLAAGTQYWVRVKHTSADPVSSAWSALSTFTTAAASSGQLAFGLSDGINPASIPASSPTTLPNTGLAIDMFSIGFLGIPNYWSESRVESGTAGGVTLAVVWGALGQVDFVVQDWSSGSLVTTSDAIDWTQGGVTPTQPASNYEWRVTRSVISNGITTTSGSPASNSVTGWTSFATTPPTMILGGTGPAWTGEVETWQVTYEIRETANTTNTHLMNIYMSVTLNA